MTGVNLMLTEWDTIKRTVDLIASSHLSQSLFTNRQQMAALINELYNTKDKLVEDYQQFIVPLTDKDNTVVAVCLRYSFKTCVLAVDRLLNSLEALTDFTPKSCDQFTRDVLVSKNLLASDIPHRIFTNLSLDAHLNRLTPAAERPQPKVIEQECNPMSRDYVPPPLEIVYDCHPDLSKLLDDCITLASYPVVSPNVAGQLITTHGYDTYTELKLNEAGPDSRRKVSESTDPRVCVICKIDNMALGYTDVVEQHKRLICQCILQRDAESQSYLDCVTHSQASKRVRERLIKDTNRLPEVEKKLFYDSFNLFASFIAQTKIHMK